MQSVWCVCYVVCVESSITSLDEIHKFLTFHVISIISFTEKQTIFNMGLDGDPELEETEASLVGWIWQEISSSYINIGLTVAIVYLLYKILFQKDEEQVIQVEPPLPPMKKQVIIIILMR